MQNQFKYDASFSDLCRQTQANKIKSSPRMLRALKICGAQYAERLAIFTFQEQWDMHVPLQKTKFDKATVIHCTAKM